MTTSRRGFLRALGIGAVVAPVAGAAAPSAWQQMFDAGAFSRFPGYVFNHETDMTAIYIGDEIVGPLNRTDILNDMGWSNAPRPISKVSRT